MKELKVFLKSLELSKDDNSVHFPLRSSKDYEGLETTEPEAAALNFKSLQSFVAGVSKQRQDDVLNSLLLAQRGATASAPKDDQIIEWYKKYFEILERIGWVIEGNDFTDFNTQHSIFEIDNALLDILSTVVTGNQLAILLKTIQSFKSLSSDDKRFVAFEKSTHSVQKGSFQLGVASQENDTLSISGSAFILNTKKNISKILFFNSDKDSTEFKFRQVKATLNDGVFVNARELIKQKLGDVSPFLAALEI
jgi:hypothetical protein